MRLLLDAGGGVAGDMLCAGLLSLGADADQVLEAMEMVGGRLGEVSAALEVMADGVSRLRISLENNDAHLAASRARRLLTEGMESLSMPRPYRDCGRQALEILIQAETEAHSRMPEMDHHIRQHDGHDHDHDHGHEHGHEHPHHQETYLHEAQDIVMDICGVMTALWSLKLDPEIELLGPLAVGGGTVSFSHGTLPVPAPAARAFVINLICPHTLSARPLVIADENKLAVIIAKSAGDLVLSVDGQVGEPLKASDRIEIRRSAKRVRLMHLPDYSYFAVLRQKLHWRGSTIN